MIDSNGETVDTNGETVLPHSGNLNLAVPGDRAVFRHRDVDRAGFGFE